MTNLKVKELRDKMIYEINEKELLRKNPKYEDGLLVYCGYVYIGEVVFQAIRTVEEDCFLRVGVKIDEDEYEEETFGDDILDLYTTVNEVSLAIIDDIILEINEKTKKKDLKNIIEVTILEFCVNFDLYEISSKLEVATEKFLD